MAKYDNKGKEIKGKVKGFIAVREDVKSKYALKESFKGEVKDIEVKFPRDLGVEHPFEFEDVEKTYERVGIVSASINKMTNSIVGDFMIKAKNPKVHTIIQSFIKTTGFSTVIREWVKEGFLKGNGFIEIDFDEEKIRVLNANNMYVKRNKKGAVIGYNQWIGSFKNYSRKNNKFTNFKPHQIAHLTINKISGKAYGIGMVWQNERTIENLVLNDEALHKIISRKAGAPLHVKVGVPGESARPEDINDFNEDLKYLTNTTEWTTDANVEIKVVDFGELGKSVKDTLDHDMTQFAYGMEIPVVLMGAGNVPEGLAKVQLEDNQRKMRAIQEEIECIIEEKIFKPLLNNNKLDGEVEFIWNLPGEEEINKRIEKLTKIIENLNVSEPLREMCELEIARLLQFENAEEILAKPKKETEEEIEKRNAKKEEQEEEETTIKQPEVPGEKPGTESKRKPLQNSAKDKTKEDIKAEEKVVREIERAKSGEMKLNEYVNLQEIEGFNYSDYVINILRRLRIDKFEHLIALSEKDLDVGKLPRVEIEKLRMIFREGFRRNKTVRDIEKEIKQSINLTDVIKNDKIIVKAIERPNLIARTESVRLANIGLIDTYKENGIKKVRWLAAVSDRTCPDCMELNGRVFEIGARSPPPLHPRCRCSLLSVRET